MKNIKKPLIFVVAIGLIYYAFSSLYLVGATFLITISHINQFGEIDPIVLAQSLIDQVFLSTLFAQIATLLLCLVLLSKEKITSFLNVKKTSLLLMFIAFVAGLSMVFISHTIIDGLEFLFPKLVSDSLNEMTDLLKINSWLLFVPVVLMAPIVEEVLYRGILFRVFKKEGVKAIWIIIISGVIFGLIHLNFVQSSYAMVLGMLMALAYYWSKNILIPILMHFGNNLLAVILTFERVDRIVTMYPNTYQTIGFYMMIVVLPITLLIIFLYRDRSIETIETTKFRLSDEFIYQKDMTRLRLVFMFSAMIIFASISFAFIKSFTFTAVFSLPAGYWIFHKWKSTRSKNRFKELYKSFNENRKLSNMILAIEKLEREPLSDKNQIKVQLFKASIWMFYKKEFSYQYINEIELEKPMIEYYLIQGQIQLFYQDLESYEKTYQKIQELIDSNTDKEITLMMTFLDILKNIHILNKPDPRVLHVSKDHFTARGFIYYLICKHYCLLNQIEDSKLYYRFMMMSVSDMQELKTYINQLENMYFLKV